MSFFRRQRGVFLPSRTSALTHSRLADGGGQDSGYGGQQGGQGGCAFFPTLPIVVRC